MTRFSGLKRAIAALFRQDAPAPVPSHGFFDDWREGDRMDGANMASGATFVRVLDIAHKPGEYVILKRLGDLEPRCAEWVARHVTNLSLQTRRLEAAIASAPNP